MTAEEKAFNSKKDITAADFTNYKRVADCVTKVQALNKEFSDVLDADGHQYVNLVQKGGGVLGVALVGYTYILEQAGIRFLKMAGTSAGAINTSLMIIQEDKRLEKSPYLLDALSKLEMINLVDGHPVARMLIQSFVKDKDFAARAGGITKTILGLLVLLIIASFVCLGLQLNHSGLVPYTTTLLIVTGIYLAAVIALGGYTASLMKRLKGAGFGINPGDFFYDWIKGHMTRNNITNTTSLEDRAKEKPDTLRMRDSRKNESISDLEGSVTFISSELVTQNKFELPAMAKLFRAAGKVNDIHPAGFVRASMAIPVFFESYYVKDIPCDDPAMVALWQKTFNISNPPGELRFVDGGILSNFPINLFYNKDIETPRLPTFGIDLDDSTPEDKTNLADKWSFGGYIGRMFNTVRFYYDKDFLLKNEIMNKGIGKVPVAKFNWLNFFLTNTEKRELFALGAEAACTFLQTFDWQQYKANRTDYHNDQQG